jgi:Protein of unknown function (DUF2637)
MRCPHMDWSLAAWRDRLAHVVVIGIVLADAIAFSLSYRGLWEWADHHGFSGGWQFVYPVIVDSFIAVGEALLFRSLVDRRPWKSRAPYWLAVGMGIAASTAGNVGHVWDRDWGWRVSAAIPPVAAAAMLWLGLRELKSETRRPERERKAARQAPTEVAAEAASSKATPVPVAPGRDDVSVPEPPDEPAACRHAALPRRSDERVLTALEHFRECTDVAKPSDRQLSAWAGVHRDTLKRKLNGQLQEAAR